MEQWESGDWQCLGGECSTPISRTAAARHRRRLFIVLAIILVYFAIAVAGALATGSLALFAEAGHMFTDAGGLALALFAIWFAERPADAQRTYGFYRAEILAALANALVLFIVAGFIFYEAFARLKAPPEIQTLPMIVVAAIGLLVNFLGVWMLHRGAEESLNVQAAFLEVLSDALGALGVLVAGIVMLTTGFYIIDPILSVLIGALILPRTWRLLNKALNVLLEGSPSHINIAEVRDAILSLPGVCGVHDLHVWTITAGFESMSGHVVTCGVVDRRALLERLRRLMHDRFSVEHLTVQLEDGPLDRKGAE